MSRGIRPGEELIRSKLRIAPLRPESIARARLTDELAAYEGGVVLISSPAGYGKSTMLQQWATSESRPVAFVRLDGSESDPVMFWRYVAAALETIDPALVADAQRELGGSAPLVDDVVVPRLLNALEASDDRIVLMLDDFHQIKGDVVPASLEAFLHHAPKVLTVAVATRRANRLSLARLRAQGQVRDVDMAELRFTFEETAAAVHRFSPARAASDAQTIHRLTEGWAAGVYLASREGARVTPTGAPGALHSYLIAEMLDAFEPEDRAFMQSTSILEELGPDVCDAVTQQGGAGERLQRLARSNLMLVAIDEVGTYRYHHLLQEVLQVELLATRGAASARSLHGRASTWYREQNRVGEAIRHAIEARMIDDAADLLCRNWYDFVFAGQVSTTQRWVGWFDETDCTAHPPLAVAGAHVYAFAGDREGSERLVRLATRLEWPGDPLDGSSSYESSVAIMNAFIAPDGPARAAEHAEHALALEPKNSPWRPALTAIKGLARLMEADDRSLDALLVEAGSTSTGPLGLASYALGGLALVNAWRGNWATAAKYADEAIRLIEDLRLGDLLTSGLPYAVRAAAAGRAGDMAHARELLDRAVRLSERRGGGLPYDSLLLSLAIAEAAIEIRSSRLIAQHLARAQQLLTQVGDAGRTEQRLNRLMSRAHGTGRTRSATTALHPAPVVLTARELQVLGLLRTAMTLDEIGQRLYVSRETVKSHVRRSYRKLGVHGRTEAIAEAERLGIL